MGCCIRWEKGGISLLLQEGFEEWNVILSAGMTIETSFHHFADYVGVSSDGVLLRALLRH